MELRDGQKIRNRFYSQKNRIKRSFHGELLTSVIEGIKIELYSVLKRVLC